MKNNAKKIAKLLDKFDNIFTGCINGVKGKGKNAAPRHSAERR